MGFSCNICGNTEVSRRVERGDGRWVLFCADCGLGVIDDPPASTEAFYRDGYYSQPDPDKPGYQNYAFTAEHGLLWAGLLVQALAPSGGRILDVGCADGFLLRRLSGSYECFGIEANTAAAEQAAAAGISIIARDIDDPRVTSGACGTFDVITLIATLEHVPDFSGAFATSLQRLVPAGVLLFEVPLISAHRDNTNWFHSSYEHIYYPTQPSLARLFHAHAAFHFLGVETEIKGFGTNYIGAGTRDPKRFALLQMLFRAMTQPEPEGLDPALTRLNLAYHLVHRFEPTAARVFALPALLDVAASPNLLKLLTELWHADSVAAATAHQHEQQARAWREAYDAHAAVGATRLLRGALLVLGAFKGGRGRRSRLRQLWLGFRIAIDREARATWRRHFDASWYLASNPDVLKAGPAPALHYLLNGHLEGREVSREGGSLSYLKENPDVAAAGVNPLAHYALFGMREGRVWPSPGPPETRINTVWPDDLPLVSVVIPCFNYGRHLRESLETVLRQTWGDLEVIVVEGGSTDAESLEAFRTLAAEAPPRTKFLSRSERHQAGDNRNFGISRARGRYVCCLDADDLLDAIYLEVALFLAERFGYELVYPSVRCFGESAEVWPARDARFPEIAGENAVSTIALFKKSSWAAVGGYRDWGLGDRHVPEDWEFWTRILGHGCRVKSIRAPLLLYRVHAGSLSRSSASDVRSHAEQIFEANRPLIERGRAVRGIEPHVVVVDGYCNLLEPSRGPVRADAVLLALPFITIGGAEHLLATLGKALVDSGQLLIVTTSEQLPDTVPSVPELFLRMTPHVYDLAALFSDEEHRSEFMHYLVARYRVGTLLLAGSRLVYSLLPELRARRPHLSVVDHLFNDTGHLESNCRFRELIDFTLVPSESLREILVSGRGADPARVVTVPHGVAPRESEPAAAWNRPAAWKPEDPVVAFFGRMSAEKGPQLFVRIALGLARVFPANFIMTGDGPHGAEVRSLIREAGREDRFFTPGFVADVLPLMLSADIVVIPSVVDGLPLVALESLALGKPVVASAVGGLPEVVRDGETGFLCASGDVAAFCGRIGELLVNPALRHRLGEAGRRLIRSAYGSDRMVAGYVRAFGEARRVAMRR